jgi:hypothetical protein
MKWTVVRYRTRPERADENQRLIEAVFRDLAERSPPGVAYTVLRLADDSFVHIAASEDGAAPVTALAAFEDFRRGAAERRFEAPVVAEATLIGSYARRS